MFREYSEKKFIELDPNGELLEFKNSEQFAILKNSSGQFKQKVKQLLLGKWEEEWEKEANFQKNYQQREKNQSRKNFNLIANDPKMKEIDNMESQKRIEHKEKWKLLLATMKQEEEEITQEFTNMRDKLKENIQKEIPTQENTKSNIKIPKNYLFDLSNEELKQKCLRFGVELDVDCEKTEKSNQNGEVLKEKQSKRTTPSRKCKNKGSTFSENEEPVRKIRKIIEFEDEDKIDSEKEETNEEYSQDLAILEYNKEEKEKEKEICQKSEVTSFIDTFLDDWE